MGKITALEGKEALTVIRDIFSDVESGSELRVKLTRIEIDQPEVEFGAKVAIAGFSDERRRKNGKLDTLTRQEGSVLYYGPVQPDFYLLMDRGGKSTVLPLENIKLLRTVEADIHSVRLTSPLWKGLSTVDIMIPSEADTVVAEPMERPIFTGRQALDHFVNALRLNVNNGTFVARLGKWVSKKAFDKALTREQAEKIVLTDAIARPEKELLRTMAVGTDIETIEVAPSSSTAGSQPVLKVRTHLDSTEIRFKGMVIEPNTSGKEVGARDSLSTYVYLIGTSFSSPSNLVIIRQRKKTKR